MTTRGAPPVTVTNDAWQDASPVLSILTPFYRDDPGPLLSALDVEARALGAVVEFLVADDGTGDAALAEAVAARLGTLTTPACFLRFERNQGRAATRNALAARARGGHLVFLDADVAPGGVSFLGAYLDAIRPGETEVIVGGFTMGHSDAPERALHRYMSDTFNCLTAEGRQAAAWKYAYSSNVLVPAEVFAAEPFDGGYVGWGWEDLEWGMRIHQRWPIRHIDNTVVHDGLDDDHALLEKITQSCGNFVRVATAHPVGIATYECYRVAGAVRRLPGRRGAAAVTRALALARWAPLPLRGLAVRIYRALIYSLALYPSSSAGDLR